MKKAALPMSQPLQNRTSVLEPAVDQVLPLAKAVHTSTTAAGIAVKPAHPQRNRPKARAEERSAATDTHVNTNADENTNTDTNIDSASVSLATAVASNNVAALRALIKEGVDLRPKNWYETPVLATAAAQGYEEIVQLLIAAHANVNNGYDALPLTSAAQNGHIQIVRYLLAAGAALNAQDANGHNAAMAAAANGHLEVVRFLVERGAQLKSTGSNETALTLAKKGRHRSVYAFLHQIMYPIVEQPEVSPDESQTDAPTTISVMDEMIARTADELNELLSSAATNTES